MSTTDVTKEGALDIHDAACAHQTSGYDTPLTLHPFTAQRIVARMRGISSITAVLQVDVGEAIRLGGFLRGGLLDAIDSLAFDVQEDLEQANERAQATPSVNNQPA